MDGNASDDNFSVDWNTDDDLDVESSSHPVLNGIRENGESRLVAVREHGEASTSSEGPRLSLISHFVGMGFSKKLVSKAVDENGDGDTDAILNALLTYSTLEESAPQEQSPAPQEQSPAQNSDPSTSDYNEMDLLLEMDNWSDGEIEEKPNVVSEQHRRLLTLDNLGSLSEKEKKLLTLANMGYTVEEASIAMDRCGQEASVSVLTDFILAAQMAREEDCYLPTDDLKPKRILEGNSSKKRKHREKKNDVVEDLIRLPNPMIGFGTPSIQPERAIRRHLPEASQGPPYFYYENVALAPKGVWDTISRFLYEIEPEFVDSKYFSATARKRGYIHNLPIENRFPLVPLPPMTIKHAIPHSKRWWPDWDPREKLNCIQTAIGSAKLAERIRSALETCDGNPPSESVQREVLLQCRKWNLVWVGRNKVAPLEPDEMEMLLGFPKNHTRGGGISRTDRYKSLGNSFQVDTVAYHLSVLKNMYPDGLNMLSLFSGIGGAEVALHRLGVKLRHVISIEKSKVNRDIVRSWWEQTNQTGSLIDFDDVQQFDAHKIEQIMESIGGFDLVVGGSPCNNLAGSNRVSRDGLEGTESSLFYDYFRILDAVRSFRR